MNEKVEFYQITLEMPGKI